MYQYRQVLVRMRQGDSDRDIARCGLMGRRKTAEVRLIAEREGWMAAEVPLPEDAAMAAVLSRERSRASSTVSSLEPFREQVQAWYREGIQGTTILSALRRHHGYEGSYSAIARFLQHLAAEDGPPQVTSRLSFAPAEAAQVDFGSGPPITDAHTGEQFKTWVFVMTLCWSRHQYAELVRDQSSATWLGCHRRAFEWFGGVPGRVIIDNPKCAITRACSRDPSVQRAYAECAEGYGFRIDPCPPRDPQKKGIVEAGVKFVKRAFLPLREFRSLADGNRELRAWVLEVGDRVHGTMRERPLVRFAETEKALLGALPAIPPQIANWSKVKVHRDAHVQCDYSYYSVPFRLIGETLWCKATATLVSVYREHECVATHVRAARRGTARTLPDHMPPEALAWRLQDTQWCLREAERIGPLCRTLVEALFADRVLENRRAVQGLLGLEKRYGASRLEAACQRALAYDTPRYRAVKTILAKGLDQMPAEESAPANETYARGGRFCRDTRDLFIH